MYNISKYFQNIFDLSTIDVPKHLWKLLKEFRKTSHVTWYSTDESVVRQQNMKLEILWLLYNKKNTQQEHVLSELNYKTRLKVHIHVYEGKRSQDITSRTQVFCHIISAIVKKNPRKMELFFI
jgi:hypothetical protein